MRVIDPSTGNDLASTLVRIDCVSGPDSRAAITLDCESDRLLVDVANRGGEPTVLTVLSERNAVVRTELSGRSAEQLELPIDGREEMSVLVVDLAGNRILDQLVGVDCPRVELSASVHVDCVAGEVIVEVSNAGDLDGSATVWFADRVLELRVVAGSTADISSPLAVLSESHDRTVTVLSGDQPIHASIVDERCVEPSARIDFNGRVFSLELTNEGEGLADFGVEIFVNGVLTLERRVPVPTGMTTYCADRFHPDTVLITRGKLRPDDRNWSLCRRRAIAKPVPHPEQRKLWIQETGT